VVYSSLCGAGPVPCAKSERIKNLTVLLQMVVCVLSQGLLEKRCGRYGGGGVSDSGGVDDAVLST
jgi:hypothetical protein